MQVKRGRAQTADAKVIQKRGGGFLNSSTSGQKHTGRKHSHHHTMYRIYMCICVHHIFIKCLDFDLPHYYG